MNECLTVEYIFPRCATKGTRYVDSANNSSTTIICVTVRCSPGLDSGGLIVQILPLACWSQVVHLRTGLMLSLAGDVRCEGCALIDNMRAGAELNRMAAPYGTTGTYNTIIGINSPAMAGRNFPHFVRDDPDAPQTYGWCAPATHTSCNE